MPCFLMVSLIMVIGPSFCWSKCQFAWRKGINKETHLSTELGTSFDELGGVCYESTSLEVFNQERRGLSECCSRFNCPGSRSSNSVEKKYKYWATHTTSYALTRNVTPFPSWKPFWVEVESDRWWRQVKCWPMSSRKGIPIIRKRDLVTGSPHYPPSPPYEKEREGKKPTPDISTYRQSSGHLLNSMRKIFTKKLDIWCQNDGWFRHRFPQHISWNTNVIVGELVRNDQHPPSPCAFWNLSWSIRIRTSRLFLQSLFYSCTRNIIYQSPYSPRSHCRQSTFPRICGYHNHQ